MAISSVVNSGNVYIFTHVQIFILAIELLNVLKDKEHVRKVFSKKSI